MLPAPDAPPASPRAAHRRRLAALAALVALLALAVWRVSALAEHRLQQQLDTVPGLRAAWQATPNERPVLFGETVDGDAWPHYQRAMAALVKAKVLAAVADGKPDTDLVAARAALERDDEAFREVARGAHSSRARLPLPLDQPFDDLPVEVAELSDLVTALRARARLQRFDGRPGAADATLLDAAQLARDAMRNAVTIAELAGGRQLAFVCADLAEAAASAAPAELVRLDDALVRLAASFGPHETMRNQVLLLGLALRRDPFLEQDGGLSCRASWRFLFSDKLMLADAFASMRELVEIDQRRPWAEGGRRVEARLARMQSSYNPLLRDWSQAPQNILEEPPYVEAMVAVLRAGVHYYRTGERSELPDPCGDRLRWSPPGSPAAVWSRGPDTVDDGGRGSFSLEARPADIVLELR